MPAAHRLSPAVPPARLRTGPLLLILVSGVALGAAPSQRRVIEDFEDAGTWRVSGNAGVAPGAWFAASIYLGSAPEAAHDGAFGGEIRHVFNEDRGPWRMNFIRQKARIVKGILDGIEFDADARGNPGTLAFRLIDSAGKSHAVEPVRLRGPGWQRHRVEIDASTVKTYATLRFPAALEQIVFESGRGGTGSIHLDDLALTGEFTRQDQVSIHPVYETIAHRPGEPVRLRYRLRNAAPGPVEPSISFAVRPSGSDATVFVDRRTVVIPTLGVAEVAFDAGTLPIGAYEAPVSLEHQGVTVSYEDHFGVFEPNNRRLNRSPMWFGVQDLNYWQAPAENKLHLGWMRALGVDLNRLAITGGRFRQDLPLSLQACRDLVTPVQDAGVDSVLSVMEGSPWFNQTRDSHAAATDLAGFEAHAEDLARFFAGFPSVRYVEFLNEPDLKHFYSGTYEEYRAMFRAFSAAFRKHAPAIKVGTGGVTVLHPREKKDFSKRLYQENGDDYDFAFFHAHGPLANYVERQGMIEGWLAGAGLEKRIANTEAGERSGYTATGRHRQAIELVKKMAWTKARPGSEFHLWFTLQDYWDFDPGADDSFGLVTSDNRAKPAFVAYNALIRRLANTTPQAVAHPAEVEVAAFVRDDDRHVCVVWPAQGKTGAVLLLRSTAPIGVSDLFGRDAPELPPSAATVLPLGQSPVYLESAAPIRFLAPDEVPLRAPAEVYRDPAEATRFSASLRNDADTALSGRLALFDPAGRTLWQSPVALAAGVTLAFSPEVPPSAPSPAAKPASLPLRLAFEPADATDAARAISLPVVARPAHPIGALNRAAFHDRPATLPALVIDQAQDVFELAFDPSIPAWRGADDLSAQAWFAHDGKHLLVRIEVADDKHVQPYADAQLWKADCVQLAFFNPANSAHTLIDMGLTSAGPVVWAHKAGDGSAPGAWRAEANFRRENNRTLYEAALPLARLGFAETARPVPIRFAFLVNEDDGQGRVRWMHWFDGLGKNKNVDELGHGLLK